MHCKTYGRYSTHRFEHHTIATYHKKVSPHKHARKSYSRTKIQSYMPSCAESTSHTPPHAKTMHARVFTHWEWATCTTTCHEKSLMCSYALEDHYWLLTIDYCWSIVVDQLIATVKLGSLTDQLICVGIDWFEFNLINHRLTLWPKVLGNLLTKQVRQLGFFQPRFMQWTLLFGHSIGCLSTTDHRVFGAL